MSREDLTSDERETYDAVIEKLAAQYKPRAIALLERIRDACREAGMRADDEPIDLSADDYQWNLSVWRKGSNEGIGVSIEIAEALSYGDDPPCGVNFSLSIVESGGRIVGGLTPFNYTDDVWVDARNAEAIEERWLILEHANVADIPLLIEEAQ